MYDELVKKIRHCATDPMHCLSCGETKDGQCFKRLMTQAADAIVALCNLCASQSKDCSEAVAKYLELWAKQPRWIPVTERLPQSQGPFLTRYGFGDVSKETGQFFYGVLYYFYADVDPHWQHESAGIEVTHWMPLPEPPKEG